MFPPSELPLSRAATSILRRFGVNDTSSLQEVGGRYSKEGDRTGPAQQRGDNHTPLSLRENYQFLPVNNPIFSPSTTYFERTLQNYVVYIFKNTNSFLMKMYK